MKYDFSQVLTNFKGEKFVTPVLENGQPVIVDGKPQTRPSTLGEACENALVNADPQEFRTGEQKLEIHKLLVKVSQANPTANLTAEEVTLLKKIVGRNLTLVAVGAIYHALENPVTLISDRASDA